MPQNIIDLHQEVLDFLLEKRNEPNFSDLYFTLRKTNDQGRLSKGYWFWGNEDSLYFSFWNGIDWKSQTPNISITIDLQGKILIFINSRDSEQKANFFKDCINHVGRFTQYKNKDGVLENQWRRNYSREDWKDALTNFIVEDKPFIDGLLAQKNHNVEGFRLIEFDAFLHNAQITNIFLPKFGLPIIQTNPNSVNSSNQNSIQVSIPVNRLTIFDYFPKFCDFTFNERLKFHKAAHISTAKSNRWFS